ncbi:hypothetical protein D3C86_1123310 [compost metagenome]
MDEGAVGSRAQQTLGGFRGGFEEIAQHGVVAHLEGHAALGHGAGLQVCDHAAAVVAQGAGGVQFGPVAGVHEAAVARQMRRLLDQAVDQIGQQMRQLGVQRQPVETGQHPRGRPRQRIARRGGEQPGQSLRRRQPRTDGRQVTRSAAPQRQPRRRPRHIGRGPQPLPQIAAQVAPLQQPFHRVQPGVDRRRIAQGPRDAFRQRPRPARGDAAVDAVQQAAVAFAPLGAVDLEAETRRRINGQKTALARTARRGQGRDLAGLGGFQIGGDQAERRDLGLLEGAETVQRRNAIEPLHPVARPHRLGQGLRHGLNHAAGAVQRSLQRLVRKQAVGDQHLRRPEGRQRGAEIAQVASHAVHRARRQFDHSHRRTALAHRHRRQTVGPARVQQAVLGQGARRHHPHHAAMDHRLVTTFLGLGGVLQLLADGDLEAHADQPRQIAIQRMDRHPGHGNVLALMLAALGQGDAQGRRRLHRVVEEQLVEVAHAEEQDGVRLIGLGRQELRHDRRRSGVGLQIGLRGMGQGRVHTPCKVTDRATGLKQDRRRSCTGRR